MLEGPVVPGERLDIAVGIICSVLANALGDGKRTFRPADFVPQWAPRVQTAEEQVRVAEAIASSFAAAKEPT